MADVTPEPIIRNAMALWQRNLSSLPARSGFSSGCRRGWQPPTSSRKIARSEAFHWGFGLNLYGRRLMGQAESGWQLEASAPELYERYMVPGIARLWAADLVERAAPKPGERVLDVACGTGIVARLAAAAMGTGHVAGLDINHGMLAVARSRSAGSGLNIEWHEASALDLPFPDSSFDLILCQLGLQFFPDQLRALREMIRLLVPDGRLALSVFTAIERTPVTNALAAALDRYLGPQASAVKRSEHSLSDPDHLHQLVAGAGFREVTIEQVIQTIRFDSAQQYVHFQLSATPLASLVGRMANVQRSALESNITRDISAALASVSEEGLTSPQEVHVVRARK
jgi:ubiquinone/menaquinone biosynthesis C-methylase UbiE